jgi:hypothetical protein
MADLMNSMNDDIHLMPSSSPNNYGAKANKSTHCAVCNEEFDYRDDVKQSGNNVRFLGKNNKEIQLTNKTFYIPSVTIRHVLLAACVALHLINVVHIMNMKVNFIVREIFMWSKIVSCVLPGKLVQLFDNKLWN